MINRRRLAVSIFSTWLDSNDFIDHIFDSSRIRNKLNEQDKNWLQLLIYSSIEHYYFLEDLLGKVTSGKFKKNNTIVKSALFLASNEILFMKTAEYAIVNEYVNVVKDHRLQFFVKVVNGVLRKISRDKNDIRKRYDKLDDLHLKYNLNHDLAKKLSDQFEIKLIKNWLGDKKKTLWARKKQFGLENDNFFIAENFNDIREDLEKGNLSIQDRSAGLLIEELDLSKGMTVLDFCSAPGGKSTYIAERCSDDVTLIATDENLQRLKLVDENAQRLGLKSIQTRNLEEVSGKFDLVLVDMPCSGVGVIKKRIDLSIKCDSNRLNDLEGLQRNIINKASEFVKIGGELAISTCTILKSENEDLVHSFLSKSNNFELKNNFLNISPFSNEHDGAFLAILKRIK